ncbi:type I methionyl aminopeptidase [Candidatus Saccharibacteria bacterium]|nr:type I methionyl aminopeptidase [Candidatus Saccharibacteria bacterium]
MNKANQMTPLTSEQIEKARIAGRNLAELFQALKTRVAPGITTKSLDLWVEKEIIRRGCEISYHDPKIGFPGSICISLNDEVVHGVPDDTVLKASDVVKFDLVIGYRGIKVDSAFTMVVGEQMDVSTKHLLDITERALYAGIETVKGPVRVGEISSAIENVLKKGKLGIVRELCGHGIGVEQWQPPEIPNYGNRHDGPVVPVGVLLAIEPMASLGEDAVMLDEDDGWTYHMRDGSLAAHFEHTVLVTPNGCEILTQQ